MAVSDHWHRVAKFRSTIVEVDPSNNIIDVRVGDGAPRRIMVWEVPSGFRWPIVGEDWSIYEQNGSWYLGDRINDLLDDHPIANMQPGDQRLDGSRVFNTKGDRLLSVDMTGIDDGSSVVYDDTEDRFRVAAPTSAQALSGIQIRDVGESGQIKAGRVLTPADFTNMGLSAPIGLWNLSNISDASGNNRNLINKATATTLVDFTQKGITGTVGEAATFNGGIGATPQVLYIADTGVSDPLRISGGSWGCWFRTAKRATAQYMIGKWNSGQASFLLGFQNTNNVWALVSTDGNSSFQATGVSDCADDRLHFAVATHDGTVLRLYIDGNFESSVAASTPIFSGSAPFNIGSFGGDGSTAPTAASSFYGRIDEAFATADILSPDHIRNLYCTRIPHNLGFVPTGARINARRRRRGGAPSTTDFPSTPNRLYPFANGSLINSGSDANGAGGSTATLIAVGGGTIAPVSGPNGAAVNAYSFSGAHTGLGATDLGLPGTTASRSYGCWLKTVTTTASGIWGWGTSLTADARILILATGILRSASGADPMDGLIVNDGIWHHAVAIEDNAPFDLIKRKLYIDGRLVASSLVLNSLTITGATNRARVGSNPDGSAPFIGQVAAPFILAGALTPEQVHGLYNVGSQTLASSPTDPGAHIEAFELTSLLATFDTLQGCDTVDLKVSE